MGRWRHSGTNWEGRRWVTSFPIHTLAIQLDELYPEGGSTDGTVAGQAHDKVSPNSDHRPTPHNGFGLVRAIDVHVEPKSMIIPEILRLNEDDRIKYVIFNGRIFSGKDGSVPFVWRDYDGPNPHATHFHLSVLDDADTDRSPWDLGGDDMPTAEEVADAVWAAIPGGTATTWQTLIRIKANTDLIRSEALTDDDIKDLALLIKQQPQATVDKLIEELTD